MTTIESYTVDVDDWMDGTFSVSTNYDEDAKCNTLAEAYLYAAKRCFELSEEFLDLAMDEFKRRDKQ